MQGWLLLRNIGPGATDDDDAASKPGLGLAVPFEVSERAPSEDVTDPALLAITIAKVNDKRSGEFASSAKESALATLRLLCSEFAYATSLGVLGFRTGALGKAVSGRSTDLAFALATFLRIAADLGLAAFQPRHYAATGRLIAGGYVDKVNGAGLRAKLRAALGSDAMPSGSVIFYPGANARDIDALITETARERDIKLVAVARLHDALDVLGYRPRGAWSGSPYRSLSPHLLDHHPIFFGRDAQIDELRRKLQAGDAAGRPGAFVSGSSGSGKSSLVLAGLLGSLYRRPIDDRQVEYAVWRPSDLAGSMSSSTPASAPPATSSRGGDDAALARSILASWRGQNPEPIQDVSSSGAASAESIRARTPKGFNGVSDCADVDSLGDLEAVLASCDLRGRRLVWVCDQFEEVVTQRWAPDLQLALLRFMARLQARGLWVVCTVRGEFRQQLLDLADDDRDPLLARMYPSEACMDLPGMNRFALTQVIAKPAMMADVRFQTRESDGATLVEVIRDDALSTENTLPLLEFALHELWRRCMARTPPSRELTFDDYDSIGGPVRGLKGAIGHQAERAFETLSPEARSVLPALLSALAVPTDDLNDDLGDDPKKEAARPVDAARWPVGSPGRALIDALIAIRVLTTTTAPGVQRSQVRVVHEAFFLWPRAAKLLLDSHADRRAVERLGARASLWVERERRPSELLTSDIDLALAERLWPDLRDDSGRATLCTFIERSFEDRAQRTADDRKRTRRQRSAWQAFGLAVIVGGAAGAYIKTTADAAARQALASRVAETAYKWVDDQGDAMSGAMAAAAVLPVGRGGPQSAAAEAALLHALLMNREVAFFPGHGGAIGSLAVSADGQWLLSASDDGTARVWNLRRTDAAPLVLPHDGPVSQAMFGADASTAVTVSGGRVRAWHLAPDHVDGPATVLDTANVVVARLSPDGKRLLTASADGQPAMLWDMTVSMPTARTVPHLGVRDAAFSRDGTRFATASTDQTTVLWSDRGEQPVKERTIAHDGWAGPVAFSPDGRWVASGSDAPGMQWCSAVDASRPCSTLKDHQGPIIDVAFSPDGRHLATASKDSTVRTWAVADDGSLSSSVALRHLGPVHRVVFSGDSRRLASVAEDNVARVWDVLHPQEPPVVLGGHQAMVRDVAFTPDSLDLLTASDDRTARRWQVAAPRPAYLQLEDTGAIKTDALFSPDGTHVVVFGHDKDDKVARLIKLTAAGLVESSQPVAETASTAAFSPDGRWLAVAHRDGRIQLRDLHDPTRSARELERGTPTTHLVFSGDSGLLVATRENGTTLVWDVPALSQGDNPSDPSSRTPAPPASMTLTAGALRAAAFSPDHRILVTGSDDGALRVYAMNGATPTLRREQTLAQRIVDITFSPDGKRFATRIDGAAAPISLWSADGESPITLPMSAAVAAAVFSPDAKWLYTASATPDGLLQRWSMDEPLAAPESRQAHAAALSDLAISGDGRRVATSSIDKTAALWIRDAAGVFKVPLSGVKFPMLHVRLSPAGDRLVTTSDDGSVWLWDLPTDAELARRGTAMATRCLTGAQRETLQLPLPGHASKDTITRPPC